DHLDFEQLKYYISHENVTIQVEKDNIIYLEFKTPCKYQDSETKLCTAYLLRSGICRNYKVKDCEVHEENMDKNYKRVLSTPEDVIELKKEVREAKIKELNKVIELIKKGGEKESHFLKNVDQKNKIAFEKGKKMRQKYHESKKLL
ncbi:YkgJ family cysteine cluster protein, partial [Candidatus Woesearchaeota archaeon]|nr:YkgJ family cysteine cluster protein [Candidatus Woesearchaeota archaeon]